jgi:hypothetical protein
MKLNGIIKFSCYQVTRQLTSREDSPWVNSPRSSGPDVSNADGTRLPTGGQRRWGTLLPHQRDAVVGSGSDRCEQKD